MQKRVITGLLASAYVITMILLGKTALVINVVLLLLVGTYEILQSLSAGGFRPVKWVYYPYVLLLVPAYLWGGDRGLLLMLMIGAMTAMAAAAIKHEPDPREMLAALLPAFYPALPIMALCLLATSELAHWRLFVWMAFAVSVGSDGFALFFGRAFGKHKLCPVVSPKKTVEGAIGGVLGTMVFGVIITLVYSVAANRMEAFTRTNIGVSMYVIIALLGCVAAVLGIYGDLFASVVKRQCGIKDYGTIFPGHGGILDRFDSVMFIAPFVTMVITAVFYY